MLQIKLPPPPTPRKPVYQHIPVEDGRAVRQEKPASPTAMKALATWALDFLRVCIRKMNFILFRPCNFCFLLLKVNPNPNKHATGTLRRTHYNLTVGLGSLGKLRKKIYLRLCQVFISQARSQGSRGGSTAQTSPPRSTLSAVLVVHVCERRPEWTGSPRWLTVLPFNVLVPRYLT